MKHFITFIIVTVICSSCSQEGLFSETHRENLWLIHKGAKLPIVVEGNTASKAFLILLHGGPGSSSQIFNAETKTFTNPLEERYALVYYDQRNAGIALGDWDEESLNISQHIEDLDKVIDLLKSQYGDDINLFLACHSWGSYLASSYLLDSQRARKLKAWINIDGLINRNLNNLHALERIDSIAVSQIRKDVNTNSWNAILAQIETERSKSIRQYNSQSENDIFDIIRMAENQITKDKLLSFNFNSPFSSIYNDNYDPFRIIINGNRDEVLITQMYEFDELKDLQLNSITLPSLSIYGLFDVRTPIQQGEYLNSKITTLETDKKLVILKKSAHSSMNNEPILLANEIADWVEKYK